MAPKDWSASELGLTPPVLLQSRLVDWLPSPAVKESPMNSICRVRAAGFDRIEPPDAATNPPNWPAAQGLSVRFATRTVWSALLRLFTQYVVCGLATVATFVPSIRTS